MTGLVGRLHRLLETQMMTNRMEITTLKLKQTERLKYRWLAAI